MNLSLDMNRIVKILLIPVGAVFAILVYSVIRSGLFYQYDSDELSHVQYVYLFAKNFQPHIDFYTRFTPIFSWFQWPLFHIYGFNFDTIQLDRVIMVILFLVRIIITFALIRKIFGIKVAYFFLPLFLLDPFNVFAAMQIRPDNLMMVVFMFGLWQFSQGLINQSEKLLFAAGFLFAVSLTIMLKILPGLMTLFLLFLGYSILTKGIKQFISFLLGFSFAWGIFLLYFVMIGLSNQMIQQVFIDSLTINSSIFSPTYASFFYQPNNFYLFGFGGKPLTWVYVWLILIFSAFGIFLTILETWETKGHPHKKLDVILFLKIVLIVITFTQFLWIITYKGAFIQYFLSVSWLLALFAAVLFYKTLLHVSKSIIFYNSLFLIYCFLFVVFAYASIKANFFRASVGSQRIIDEQKEAWRVISENEYAFPNTLFRPLAYPLTYGAFIGDVPKSILKRFGPVYESLEKYKVKYLILNSFNMMFLDPTTREYINNHYYLSGENQMFNIYIRKL